MIKIEVIGDSSGAKTLRDVLIPAIQREGYKSFAEFAREVAKITGNKEHNEVACISRINTGKQEKGLEHNRIQAYARILGIPEKTLSDLSVVGGNSSGGKPFEIAEQTDVTQILEALLEKQKKVTAEDVVKELLWRTHS